MEWKDVIGYESYYEISDEGQVRSRRGNKLLKTWPGNAYLSVVLTVGGNTRRQGVHKLVLEAFVCRRPPGLVANHKDTNKHNNRLANLEWVTPSRNVLHAYENGLRAVGEAHHKAKLTEQQVREIRAAGWTPVRNPRKAVSSPKLAKKYGVSHPNIQAILHGRTWRHLL